MKTLLSTDWETVKERGEAVPVPLTTTTSMNGVEEGEGGGRPEPKPPTEASQKRAEAVPEERRRSMNEIHAGLPGGPFKFYISH